MITENQQRIILKTRPMIKTRNKNIMRLFFSFGIMYRHIPEENPAPIKMINSSENAENKYSL